MNAAVILASIPSPDQGVWYLGPVPIRAYALCIIAGVVLAVWLGERRWVARGGKPGQVGDIAIWVVPFGLVGGRLYHVITDWRLYFGEGQDPVTALYVWQGGLGIWGAVALGALGAWIGCRVHKVRFLAFADAIAKLPEIEPGHPDMLETVRVVEIGGLFGGIAGFHDLYVRVCRTHD